MIVLLSDTDWTHIENILIGVGVFLFAVALGYFILRDD